MKHSLIKLPVSTILPLFLTTGVSLLATDIYLPSIPFLPAALGTSMAVAQATLPAFFIAFALCQLLHGALAEAYGNYRVLVGAAGVFVCASMLAALAPDATTLIVARSLQGVGAAAATAIAPAVIRRTYNEVTSVRLMSWLGVAESTVPALGPFLGAFVLLWFGWRATFWLLAVIGLVSLSLLVNKQQLYGDRQQNPLTRSAWKHIFLAYGQVLRNRAFLSYSVGYASAYGALMTFVGTSPYMLQRLYGQGPEAFGFMQLVLVAAFMAGSLSAARALKELGRDRTIVIGFFFLAATTLLMLIVAGGLVVGSPISITLAIIPSQVGLGLRFGVSMSAAIGSVPDRQSSASAMMSFMCFIFAAIGNAIIALWIKQALWAISLSCLAFTFVGLWALLATPQRSPEVGNLNETSPRKS